MGRTLGNIIGSLYGPLTGLIVDGGDGFVRGLTNLATAYFGGPVAVGLSVLNAAFKPSLPRPDTAVTAIKASRPPRVSAYGVSRLYPAYALYETASDGTACDAYVFHEGAASEIIQHYLNDDRITLTGNIVDAGSDGRYDNNIRVYTTLGLPTETAISALVTALPGIWTNDHRGDGVVTGALLASPAKAKHFLDIYPNSVPTLSIAARWQKCPDPSAEDPTDEAEWTWTENSIRHLLHYKLKREAVDYGTKIGPTIDYWIAAAEDCEDPTALKAGGTEARYRSNVAHKHTQPHKDVVSAILATCDGWISPRADGALIVYSGRYYEPTVSIGPDEIVSYSWEDGVEDENALNEIAIGYVSADHDYNSVETGSWRDEDDISERGQIRSDTLDAAVPSHAQARRLAKRMMARVMAPQRGTVTTNHLGRGVRGQRYINLLIEEVGATFYDGPVEITQLTRNLQSGGVTFSWIAADPNIDEWNPATEEGDPAPVGNRVAPEPLDAPVIDTATAEYSFDSASGAAGVCIEIDIDAPDREDLTWFIRTRVVGAAVWGEREYTDIAAGAAVTLVTEFVPVDEDVEVEVAYQVGDGRVSPWSATETVDTTSAGVAPASPTDLVAADGVGQSIVTWRNPTSSNFSYTRLYRGTTAVFGSAVQVGADRPTALGAVDSVTDTGLAANTYYYWVRAFNASGAGSTPTGPDTAVVT